MSNPKNVIEMAQEIVALACSDLDRSQELYDLSLKYLQLAYEWGEDSIRNSNCYHQPEDMGR